MRRGRLNVGGSKALVTAAVRRVSVLSLPLRAVDCYTRTGTVVLKNAPYDILP